MTKGDVSSADAGIARVTTMDVKPMSKRALVAAR